MATKLTVTLSAQTLNFILGDVAPLEDGNGVSACLAGSILGPGENVATSECDGDAGFLDGGRLLPAFLKNTHQQRTLQAEVLKLVALCIGHILVVGKYII